MGARLVRAAAVAAAAVPLLLAAGCGSSGDATGTADTGTDPAATQSSGHSSGQSSGPTSAAPSSAAPSTPGRSAAPAGWPSCGEVWQEGATLPARYQGCSADGHAVPAQRLGCESGQTFILYAEHYWAVRHGTIHHADRKLANSPAYSADVATCRG